MSSLILLLCYFTYFRLLWDWWLHLCHRIAYICYYYYYYYYYHYYYYLLLESFHISFSWWSFTGVWATSKSPVPRTLLSILAVHNNVVWMVVIRPPTIKSSSPFNNRLFTVPKAPLTIGIIVTFMLHKFFNYLIRSSYLSFFSLSFSFIL